MRPLFIYVRAFPSVKGCRYVYVVATALLKCVFCLVTLSVAECLCVSRCKKPQCVCVCVMRSRKWAVAVGVEAPLLPWSAAADCFTHCLLIWRRYRVSGPRPTKCFQPPSQGSGTNQPYSQGRAAPGTNQSVGFLKKWHMQQRFCNVKVSVM